MRGVSHTGVLMILVRAAEVLFSSVRATFAPAESSSEQRAAVLAVLWADKLPFPLGA